MINVGVTMAAHDAGGTVAYVMEHDGRRLGWATDLGRVTDGLVSHLAGANVLAIESNYDPGLQRASGRPSFLVRRIMGGRGHLSNEQSLRAVCAIAARSSLDRIVALHLSRQCNGRHIIEALYQQRAPRLSSRLVLSDAHEPTPMIEIPARDPKSFTISDQVPLFE